ncbi:MAG: hypothetical protein GYB68_03075 [Chloroflexi bacterium]|nr:hypothetical protein [Chloroflexota bacterium]
MPVDVGWIDDSEQVLLMTVSGTWSSDDYLDAYEKALKWIHEMERPVHLLAHLDTDQFPANTLSAMPLLAEINKRLLSTLGEDKLLSTVVVVRSPFLARAARIFTRVFSPPRTHIAYSMDKAMAVIRAEREESEE